MEECFISKVTKKMDYASLSFPYPLFKRVARRQTNNSGRISEPMNALHLRSSWKVVMRKSIDPQIRSGFFSEPYLEFLLRYLSEVDKGESRSRSSKIKSEVQSV